VFAWGRDCSKGQVEVRLDCLTRKIEQIEARLDGRLAQIVPLGPNEPPAPRVMPPWPDQPSPPPRLQPPEPVPVPPVPTPPK